METRLQAWTVGQAVQHYRGACVSLGATTYADNQISPPDLTTYLGYRAIHWTFTTFGTVIDIYAVILSLPSPATIPLRYVVSDPGWNGNLVTTYQVPADEGLDWGFQEAAWNARMPELKKMIAVDWCSAVLLHEHRENVLNLDSGEAVSIWQGMFAAATEILPCWEGLYSFNAAVPAEQWSAIMSPPPPDGVAVAVAQAASPSSLEILTELKKITDTLRDIAALDVTASLNNGAAAWSVQGRTGAGE